MQPDLEGVTEAYRAPLADAELDARPATNIGSYYVVSPKKLVTLFLATFGLYGVYWFYRHWKHEQLQGRSVSPIPRAIFSLFFVVQLFKTIDITAREKGFSPTWNPGNHAAAFIVLTLIGRVLDRLSGSSPDFSGMDLVALLVPMAAVVPLATAQGAVNLSAGDETGTSNASMTALNVVFIVLGGLLWLTILAALVLPGA